MDVDGLCLYHVKSHLQKYRQSKQPDMEWDEPSKIGFGGAEGSSIFSQQRPAYEPLKGNSKAKNDGRGSLYLRLQAETAYQKYLMAQKSYLDTIIDNACDVLISQYLLQGALVDYGDYVGQDLNVTGTTTEMPTYCYNQLNACNSYNSMETIQGQTAVEEQRNHFQCPMKSSEAGGGSLFPVEQSAGLRDMGGSKHYSGLENMNGSAPYTYEEPLEAYFNWDDDNPNAQEINYS